MREHGAVPYQFEPGDPTLLRHQDHIGCHVFMVRNPDKNLIDPVFLETCGNYTVEDPGGRDLVVLWTMSGDVFYLAPGLSGRLAHLKKLIKRLQRQRDSQVNKIDEVLAAKATWDLRRTDRSSKDDGTRRKREKLFESEQEAKASYDLVLESHRLTPVLEGYSARSG